MAEDEGQTPEQKAAEEAVDPDRLLDGEDPESRHLEDAAHWIAVYAELVGFKQRLITTAEEGLIQMSETMARKEAAGQDLLILAAERDRLVRRLNYWKRRQQELFSARDS